MPSLYRCPISRPFEKANGGADECYYNKCNARDLDHRQSLSEDNNTKHRRYNGVGIGKERRAHWSDDRYRNEKGDYCEAVEHGGCAKADPPGPCLGNCKVSARGTK